MFFFKVIPIKSTHLENFISSKKDQLSQRTLKTVFLQSALILIILINIHDTLKIFGKTKFDALLAVLLVNKSEDGY